MNDRPTCRCGTFLGVRAAGKGGEGRWGLQGRAGGGRWGLQSPQLLKLCDFSGKTLMIRATTLERKYCKIMLLA